MGDNKYIVFKRSEWGQVAGPAQEVEDAVVIRRQDVFAPPALDAYANAIQVVIETLQLDASEPRTFELMGRLQYIADYFHDQAAKSWSEQRKLPD
jgi:hypothetical protein